MVLWLTFKSWFLHKSITMNFQTFLKLQNLVKNLLKSISQNVTFSLSFKQYSKIEDQNNL